MFQGKVRLKATDIEVNREAGRMELPVFQTMSLGMCVIESAIPEGFVWLSLLCKKRFYLM